MEAGERGKEELQTQIPWIPTTPLKPIRPRPVPICGSGERNQLNQTDFLGASTCCNSTHDSHAYRVSACFESAPNAEINSRLHDWEAPAATGTNIAGENSGTCPQIFHNPMSRWANTGCTELLALADAASAAHFNATHPDNDGVKSPFILISESQLNRDPVANLSSFLTHHDLSPQQTQTETIHVNPQEPQGTTSVAFCSKTISQLAPPTPDKPIRAECRQLAGMQINVEERAEGEINNVPATKLDNNETSQNQDMSDSVTEISFAAVSMPLKENHNPHRGESEVIDLNKTPQQKSRRKKHRPKVISEGKSKRTQRPVIPKPAQSEKPTGKRKYVRRKGLDKTSTTPPSEVTGQSTESIMLESTKKSCRRVLNFEIGEQPIDENSACKENGTTMRLGKGVSLPEDIQAPSKSLPKNNSPGAKPNANSVKRNSKRKSQVMLSPNDSSSNNGGILTTGLQLDGSKRKHSTTIEHTDTSSMNLIGARYNGLQAYQGMCVQFPNIQKRRRSGKGQTSKISTLTALAAWTQEDARAHTYASSSSSWNFGSEYNASRVPVTFEATVHNKPQMFEGILSLIQNQTRPTKRRSKVSTQVNHSTKQLRNDDKQVFENAKKPTCIDALVAETRASLTKKKRTKKKSTLVNSAYSSTNETQMYQNLALVKSLDATQNVAWNIMEALGEQFRHLDINKEGRDFACEEQNALVLYNVQIQEHNALVHAGGGTIVPFNSSFNPIRKQRPRPKVDLDDETNRVWELLMSDINNDGIDGKDKDKAKWWEEERRVFHGRADSFVARMRLVQGDRRFSGWKGSVVDSVVGVFLTQNVSDHLSSSAFVSLAAKFALKSSSKCKRHSEEGTSLVVKEPEVLTVEPEENTQWDEKILNRSVYDENSMTIDIIEHSEEKAVNSNSTGTITEEGQEKSDYGGAGKELNDVVSSQCSVISSQISGDFSIDQNPEKLWSCTDSNSEVEELSSTAKYNLFDNSTSFSKLLQLQLASSTMLHEVTSQRIGSSDNLKHAYGQSTRMKHDYQTENLEKSGVIQGSFVASLTPSSDYTLKVTHNSGVLEVHCFDHFKTEASSSGLSNNKDENDMNKSSSQITESGNQAATAHSQSTLSLLHLKEQNNNMQQNLLHISGQSQDLMQKATELDSGNHNYAVTNETKEMSAATIKSKGKRPGKKKKEDFNWDSLRVEAEARAGKRERTINNMDSLDWDAVRCADVNEIAEAIKERGMNNMLAERIKNFLNRLVQDHGSINLEWLRDVQPDQAKEFLLSIRGLGLKSVECVRLLTLHHLAFPVDTNVGRIAVRLGWVPLQPLPESLQLHLLELYPVLESIQKYLWPRLCKLDQNTLYELHYQMITFGKVFCTKSKPNCNACPMRGECRHFASAFASARLALPGPEQRSIVSTAGDNATDQNPSVIISPLPLPLPEYAKQPEEIQQTEVSRQLEAKSGINICHPIIEEPATPEPECAQISENDMEDGFCEDPCEIPTIKLNFEEFTLNLQNFMQHNMELQEGEMSKALVALDPEAASIPMPKLKNVSRLRTEHCVYELPDDHALLEGWDKREPDDPCSYLLAIWTPGETANSIQPPESKCSSQECGKLCNEKECFSCNSIREANMHIVRGTILIPCRTAMRGRFPLNGTYFQVNEVFADHDSSLNPINVPRGSIWELRRRTVYFGTSIPTIFKGLSTQEIQHCFWRGHVCVRGFDRKTRAPRPLMARLHFPASKLAKNKEKTNGK